MPIVTEDGFYMFDLNEIVENYKQISSLLSYVYYPQVISFQATPGLINNPLSSYLSSISYPDEKFLPFVDYPNLCYISNFGRIYSLRSNSLIQGSFNKDGYVKVTLNITGGRNGKVKGYLVHRMVMMTFAPRPDYKDMQVNHINGDKTCNIYLPGDPRNNLEWCTNQENMDHAIRTGLVNNKGENSSTARYTTQEVEKVCQALQDHPTFTSREIAECTNMEYNRSFTDLVSDLRNYNRWEDVTKNYTLQNRKDEIFNESIVRQICQLLEQGLTCKEVLLAMNMDVTDSNYNRVYYIKTGETFKEISSQYNIPQTSVQLDNQTLHQICQLLEQNKSNTEILEVMGMPLSDANRMRLISIRQGKTYREISSQYNIQYVPVAFTEDTVRDICQMLESKTDIKKILEELNLEDCGKNRERVYEIRRRHTYTNISKDYNF